VSSQQTAQSIAVLGAGSWGTVLSHMNAAAGKDVVLWCRSPNIADTINSDHANTDYLPGVALHPGIAATTDLARAVRQCHVVLIAVPTSAIRSMAGAIAPHLDGSQIVVCAAKGFEASTGKRMSEVLADTLPSGCCTGTATLSGPNLAGELALGHPATSVVASTQPEVARAAASALQCPTFRVYTNPDLIGVEYGGGLKNIVAIGAGIVDGLGLGQNAKASLLTRGLAEMTRLGVAAGAHPLTFAGLAGLGDMMATCSSNSSRNHFVGQQLAIGKTWPEISAGMHSVAEGVNTTRAARTLSLRYGVPMPIADQAYAILFEQRDIRGALQELLDRAPRDELEDLRVWQSHL